MEEGANAGMVNCPCAKGEPCPIHPDKKGDNREYKVGDKNPPKEYQFKPGEVHNPKGRPKDKKYISEALKDLLASNPQLLEEVVEAILKEVKRGNIPAVKELLDRTEGKVVEPHKFESDVPVTIILKRAEDRDE